MTVDVVVVIVAIVAIFVIVDSAGVFQSEAIVILRIDAKVLSTIRLLPPRKKHRCKQERRRSRRRRR